MVSRFVCSFYEKRVRLIKVGVVEVGGQSYDLCLDSRVSTDNFSLLRVERTIPTLHGVSATTGIS